MDAVLGTRMQQSHPLPLIPQWNIRMSHLMNRKPMIKAKMQWEISPQINRSDCTFNPRRRKQRARVDWRRWPYWRRAQGGMFDAAIEKLKAAQQASDERFLGHWREKIKNGRADDGGTAVHCSSCKWIYTTIQPTILHRNSTITSHASIQWFSK